MSDAHCPPLKCGPMGIRRSTGIWLVVFAAFLASAVAFYRVAEEPNKSAEQARDRIVSAATERGRAMPADAPTTSRVHEARRSKPDGARKLAPAKAKARAQILAAAMAREAAKPLPAEQPDREIEPEPGQLTKRVEGHDALHAELNRDAMPLIQECISAAQKRQPGLGGMLAVGFELVADEDLGAIIEDVAFPEQNEVHEPELHECIHASLMSMLLPPGSENGRSELMLTIPIESDPGTTPADE